MASGRTHLAASLALGTVTAYVGYEAVLQEQYHVVEGIFWGTLGGMFITPDYDLEGLTVTEGLIFKIPVVGLLWVTMWYPYALLNQHRGRSHTLIGTFERQLYLVGLIEICLIFYVGSQYLTLGKVTFPVEIITSLSYLPDNSVLGVASFVWFLHDLLHWLFDL